MDAIFLSASVPDPKRGPRFAKTADSVAIQAAVSALIYVTLGRRLLVWGGHPAITPMIWVVAADMGVDYGSWVHLYQSNYFKDEFPEENERFNNVTFCDAIAQDREKSLLAMRECMFSQRRFSAAVFIGGMGGVIDEFKLFTKLQPGAAVIPLVSSGGAALDVAALCSDVSDDLATDLDYVAVFHRHLKVSASENRFVRLEDQQARSV